MFSTTTNHPPYPTGSNISRLSKQQQQQQLHHHTTRIPVVNFASTTPIEPQKTKTVNDNIFILEPDSIDYGDILSQIIFSSSPSFSSSSSTTPSNSDLGDSKPRLNDDSTNAAAPPIINSFYSNKLNISFSLFIYLLFVTFFC